MFMDYDEKQRGNTNWTQKRSKTSNKNLTQGTNSTTQNRNEIARHNKAIGQGICGGVYIFFGFLWTIGNAKTVTILREKQSYT